MACSSLVFNLSFLDDWLFKNHLRVIVLDDLVDSDQVVLDDLDGDQVDYCNRTTTIDATLRLPSWHN